MESSFGLHILLSHFRERSPVGNLRQPPATHSVGKGHGLSQARTCREDGAASRICWASLARVLTSAHCRSNSSRRPFPQQQSRAASRYW